jgi:chromosome segregation ATPase
MDDVSRKRSREEIEEEENESSFIDPSQMDISQLSPTYVTERINKRRPVNSADDGVIEKILLVDFMCHARLEVNLNPAVNFILGQNGSGKSAIMVAIIVALGGKATSTQRASSLKSFIRTGCSQAEIHLTLRNEGSEAYKPMDYGNSITVIRTIKRDGGTSYKIKSHSNHIIASSKEELLRIVNQFNIQVDNPVCMMSQDTGHHFLHDTSPSEKYKLFIQATHLGQKAEDHGQAREQHEFMRKEIERKKRMLPNLQNKLKDCEDQVQDIEQLKTLELKEKNLSLEFMWAVAIELENEMRNVERKVAQERQKVQNIDLKIAKYEEKYSSKKNDVDGATKELLDITDETKVIQSQTNELNNTKRTLDRELTEKKRECDTIVGNMNSIRNEKRQFEKKLEEILSIDSGELANQREALKCEHESMMNNVKLIEEKLEIARRDYQSKDNDKRLVDEASHQTKSAIIITHTGNSSCLYVTNNLIIFMFP